MSQMSSLQICVFWHRQWVDFIHWHAGDADCYNIGICCTCICGLSGRSGHEVSKVTAAQWDLQSRWAFFFPLCSSFQFVSLLVFPTKSDLDSFVFEASKLESWSPSPAALWHNQDLSTNEHQHLSAATFVFQYGKEGEKKGFFGRWTDSLGCASTAAWRDIKRYKRWECVIKSAFSLIKLWR